jgi:lysophospholipase L1-like esterase
MRGRAEIVEGIDAIRRELLQRSPQSHLVVMAIFPRGAKANDPLRAPILEVNRLLAQRFGTDASVTLLDIGNRFLQPDGSLPAAMMPDGVHPSEAGYEIWAEALRGVFAGKTP